MKGRGGGVKGVNGSSEGERMHKEEIISEDETDQRKVI